MRAPGRGSEVVVDIFLSLGLNSLGDVKSLGFFLFMSDESVDFVCD